MKSGSLNQFEGTSFGWIHAASCTAHSVFDKPRWAWHTSRSEVQQIVALTYQSAKYQCHVSYTLELQRFSVQRPFCKWLAFDGSHVSHPAGVGRLPSLCTRAVTLRFGAVLGRVHIKRCQVFFLGLPTFWGAETSRLEFNDIWCGLPQIWCVSKPFRLGIDKTNHKNHQAKRQLDQNLNNTGIHKSISKCHPKNP